MTSCRYILCLNIVYTNIVIGQTGGLSNRQKERKKAMPMAAKKAKVARSQLEKKKKQQRSGKQFRGRKSWK
jgi:protein SDA1